ncbi:hypothetical protein BJX70DRAFT_386950 [Aspergillus crustosus]
MKRFGLKKSSDGGGDDDSSNRLALFGSRSKSKSPAPSANPYAKPIPIDPYTKAKINAGVAPPPPGMQPNGPPDYQGNSGIPGDHKSQIPGDHKYQGYTPNSYGNQSGYGANRYGDSAGAAPASRYGPGGYGGLGGQSAGDDNRAALFGTASERVAAQPASAPPPYSEDQAGQPGGYAGGSNSYTTDTYQERQLTAEEEEEQEVQAVKQDIRFMKQGDISSTRNALRVAARAEEQSRETLARLGAQGEMINNAEKHLDVAGVEGRIADEKARELKTLNKSMFAVHVSNPFTSGQRRRERDDKVLNTHRADRDAQAGTRSAAFQANQRMDRTFRDIERESNKVPKPKKQSVTERAKYQFEADSEDDAMEDEIESNLNLLSGATGRLNLLAKATGRELDEQNSHLERIMNKSENVDEQLAMNRARLDRIR